MAKGNTIKQRNETAQDVTTAIMKPLRLTTNTESYYINCMQILDQGISFLGYGMLVLSVLESWRELLVFFKEKNYLKMEFRSLVILFGSLSSLSLNCLQCAFLSKEKKYKNYAPSVLKIMSSRAVSHCNSLVQTTRLLE